MLSTAFDAFREIRLAETQSELEALRFQNGDVTNRPETQYDLSAASQRNTFGLVNADNTPNYGNMLLLGALVIGLVFIAGKVVD